MEQTIIEILSSVDAELYWLLLKFFLAFTGFQIITGFARNLSIYIRLRFSDLFSKRTVIIYNDFEGVIEEISLNGIFIRNRDGVTMYVPLNRWYMGSIKYPNALD